MLANPWNRNLTLTLHWMESGRTLFALMVVAVVEIFLFHRAQPVNYRGHGSMMRLPGPP